tara:strand:+ start:79 stop:264 length:186 start_codon:yes stop_codon:yes gene_type:complete
MIKKLMAVIIALSFAGAEPVYPTQYEQLASSEEVKKKKKGKKIQKGKKKKKGFFSKVFGSK